MGTSLGCYFLYVWVSSIIPSSNIYKTSGMVFSSGVFYLALAFSVLAMFAFDLVSGIPHPTAFAQVLFTFKTTKDSLLNYFKSVARSEQTFDIERVEELNLRLDEEMRRDAKREARKIQDVSKSFSMDTLNTVRDEKVQIEL